MPGVIYRPAPEVERIGRKLINQEHRKLRRVRVEFVFRSTHSRRYGRAVLAHTQKVSGLHAFLSSATDASGTEGCLVDYFLVIVAEDRWRTLTDAQRVALIDHELSHCGVRVNDDGDPILSIRPHDIEEFRAVVERHGCWRDDVGLFADSLAKAAAS